MTARVLAFPTAIERGQAQLDDMIATLARCARLPAVHLEGCDGALWLAIVERGAEDVGNRQMQLVVPAEGGRPALTIVARMDPTPPRDATEDAVAHGRMP